MENACIQFVKELKHAQETGSVSSNLAQIYLGLGTLPLGFSIVDVFLMCKRKGWVDGTPWAPRLTTQGENISN